ncbi:hypothetical protein ACQ4PT_044338 [Festuca glaucescens]
MAGDQKDKRDASGGNPQPPARLTAAATTTPDGGGSSIPSGAGASDSWTEVSVRLATRTPPQLQQTGARREREDPTPTASVIGQRLGDDSIGSGDDADADTAATPAHLRLGATGSDAPGVVMKRQKLSQDKTPTAALPIPSPLQAQPSPAPQATSPTRREKLRRDHTALREEHLRSQADTAYIEENLLPVPDHDQPSSSPWVPVRHPTMDAAPTTMGLLGYQPQHQPPPPECWACRTRPSSIISLLTPHFCVCLDCFDAGSTACPFCHPRG